MPGGYSQAQQNVVQASAQTSTAYQSQQQDVPPPPPPKPAAFAATSQQQNIQSWGQQAGYATQQPQQSYQTVQQSTGYTAQGQQGGYAQQSGYLSQGTTQQSYSNAAPPPPSQTPGGSYFPPSQTPQAGGRPGSIYGADQAGAYSTPSSAVAQHPPNPVLSPNEQNPAYIPPSLSGQGVQSYMPANTNPMPGVYVPPPPDIPAWQQASHAPLQGGKKFKYTKPAVDPSLYAQGQGQYGQQPAQSLQSFGQSQYPTTGGQTQQTQLAQYGSTMPNQPPQDQLQQQGQYGQATLPHQSQYEQPIQQTQFPEQPNSSYHQPSYDQSNQAQTYQQQQQNQWQPTPPADHGYPQQQQLGSQAPYSGQQQTWQPGHQAQGSIQAPKPINGHTGSTPPGFVSEPSPQSQPVSPVQNRFSTSFSSSQVGLGRTGSVSSIALGAIHAQRVGNRTESPNPPPPKLPTPPPPRDDTTKFSALGTGGPSDWEHFGGGEEVDDEELFRAKREEKKNEPAQLDSVELPAQQVSPPQAQGEWPTPPTHPASTNFSNRDTYQPTPPPMTSTPAQGPPSRPTQQSFVMGDVAEPPQQLQQGFVMGDAIVAPLNVSSKPSSQPGTPAQQYAQHQPPPESSTSFVIGDGASVASQHNSAHSNDRWTPRTNDDHVTELKMKDEALERLRADAEKEKLNLRAEIEQLKVVIETTKSHAEYERNVLVEQIETMKVAAEQATNNAAALNKEKDATIERLKEDVEGKEDTIREKDSNIGNLRDEVQNKDDLIKKGHAFVDDLKQQLSAKDNEINSLKGKLEANATAESEVSELKQQLETERSRELPKAAPADLVSDIDPWYAGSLERYIAMLRSEAHETLVENKIKVFTGFLKAESGARGLDYHSAPPHAPDQQSIQQDSAQPATLSRGTSNASAKKKGLNVQVPTDSPEDDIQYSPGGRPIVQRRPTLKSDDLSHPQQSFSVSSQSTTVLTPTSSQDDGFSKTPTSVQSPPEPQAQPQYKAYVPPGVSQNDSVNNVHRQSISSASPTVLNPGVSKSTISNQDTLFFGASKFSGSATPHSTSKPSSRPTTSTSATSEVPIPAPLFTPQPPTSLATRSTPKEEDPVAKLVKLLPAKVGMPQPNSRLEAIRKQILQYSSDSSTLRDLTISWEKSASLARKKNEDARRKRQEESEEQTDQLFNDHEISYADIGDIEEEFKEQERKLKADEDRNEYNSFVETVFDKVYDGLQLQIKGLMDLYIEAESLLSTAVSGVKTFEGTDAAIMEDCLKLLEELNEQIEQRHEKVVEAVAERDKRYKKTEIQPLYAAGNITKMKTVEKHFANAEKQAAQRARDEKGGRLAEFVRVAEATVIAAVGTEQQEIQAIINAVRDLPSSPDEKLLTRARETVLALGDSSKSLLSLLNDIEIDLGGSVLEAQLTEAKADKQPGKIEQLQKQISDREKELKDELERKISVLEQDREEIDKLVKEKGSKDGEADKVEMTEEELRKARLNKALEEAKRRNGDL
ncbi:hypothetical protein N0V90_003326 [Kalmusia sp. IMI 367209]|nr:hypothetical protein N0V90_003326 [Kalmusia sp. IMI 367209]